MVVDHEKSESLFKKFLQANSFTAIRESFELLCHSLEIDIKEYGTVYKQLKTGIRTREALCLWNLLDKRAEQNVYENGKVCSQQKVFIIGAGPCGLRLAIEGRLLGSKVVMVEMRNYITRNNILHLWPSVIDDLKFIGAKIIYRKFCTGSVNHISIRTLQSVLLKVALILGVEVHAPVEFIGLNEPGGKEKGWTAKLKPENHPLCNYEFDFLVGAGGKQSKLKGFMKKPSDRTGKATAITFNLVNEEKEADRKVDEIPGLSQIYHQINGYQDLFRNLDNAGIDLENIVYYKDKTHYFVMTAKKASLLKRRVFKEDKQDTASLLSNVNINREELCRFALDTANIATSYKMPTRDFAKNHHGQDDIEIFDFTSMLTCKFSTLIAERHGHNLVMTMVGDGLVEPFWPKGTGAGRGFLSVLDAAWLLRMWGQGRPPLDCLAEKETWFQLLKQATPDNLTKRFVQHSIDPESRYQAKAGKKDLIKEQVRHLYVTHDKLFEDIEDISLVSSSKITTKRSYSRDTESLLAWYQDKLSPFNKIFTVQNLDLSWKDGRALCALVSLHRPKLLDMAEIQPEDARENIQLALDLIHKEFGLNSVLTPDDIMKESTNATMNRLTLFWYLGQLREHLLRDPSVKQDEFKEPPAKRFQQPSPSVVLMELPNREPEFRSMGMIDRAEIPCDKAATVDKAENGIPLEDSPGLAQKRIELFEREQYESILKETDRATSTEHCSVCDRKLYVVERCYANGDCIHKNCLRCAVCKCALRPNISPSFRPAVKFVCFRHAREDGISTAQQFSAVSRESKGAAEERTKPEAAMEETQEEDEEEQDTDSVEEDFYSCSEDEFFDAEDYVYGVFPSDGIDMPLQRKNSVMKRLETEYKQLTSVTLLMAQDVQDGLDEVDYEEIELEERGKQIEKAIESQTPDPEMIDEWMDVMHKKQELKEKESKLMLQMKLLELQEKKKQILKDMRNKYKRLPRTVEAKEQGRDTSNLEEITDEIANLKLYLETN